MARVVFVRVPEFSRGEKVFAEEGGCVRCTRLGSLGCAMVGFVAVAMVATDPEIRLN